MANNSAQLSKKLFSSALQGLEDAIVSFVKTGKLSFAQLAQTIEDELLHIAVKKAIAASIGHVAGFADGGIMTSGGPVPLKKYASGGIADSPQMAMFGEGSTPEAYVPLPDGRSIPVTMDAPRSSGGATNTHVNVAIHNNGQSQSASSDTEKGKALGLVLTKAITAQLLKEKRPGGLLFNG